MIGLKSIADDPLLRRLMVAGRVSDPDLERVLTVARRALLDWACGTNPSGAELIDFFGALAEQCFLNEYAFAESDDERIAVERIAVQLSERACAGGYCGYIPPAWLIATAAYRPLHAVAGTEALLGRAWPAPIERLLALEVREPLEERAIHAALPALTPIEDRVSRAVQAQYEANPYPRWVMAAPAGKPVAIDDDIRRKFPLAPYRSRGAAEHLDVLVAGCGTGAHPIETCRRYAGARVLAVDLSRASLAYAARKTRALGLPIDFAQADILALGTLDRRFGLIEASGSLQCLADPQAGWRVLSGLLEPGGLMQLGLYSKLARAGTIGDAARRLLFGERLPRSPVSRAGVSARPAGDRRVHRGGGADVSRVRSRRPRGAGVCGRESGRSGDDGSGMLASLRAVQSERVHRDVSVLGAEGLISGPHGTALALPLPAFAGRGSG
jgi:SAM-dependent methyltransferase